MPSIQRVRPAGKRKKKVLGPARTLGRDQFEAMDLNGRVEAIRSLTQIGLMHVAEEIDRDVLELAGPRYRRKGEDFAYRRHGTNPGSVRLAGQRMAVRVPRVRGPEGEVQLPSYEAFHSGTEFSEAGFRRVLYGVSCRNYEAAAEAVPGAIGLSSSTVSRQFKEVSKARLKEFQERDLSGFDVVSIVMDGKSFADDEMVLAVGVTESGEKVMLGFVQTATENSPVIKAFLRSLVDRGLDVSQGVLVVIDGSTGFRAGVRQAFKKVALVQRCQWHKRENVVKHVAKCEQAHWRKRLQRAYERPTYAEAMRELKKIHRELLEINISAARSLEEGLEETLTLHRLGVFAQLGISLKTSNCIESINSMAEGICGKVDRWRNSDQKHRWFAAALLDIEPRLRRVRGYRHLPKLRAALIRELRIKVDDVTISKAA